MTKVWILLAILIAGLFMYMAYLIGIEAVEPEIHLVTKTVTEYVPYEVTRTIVVTKEVEVIKEIYPTRFHQFESQGELCGFLAKHYLELQELGEQNNWICVDYALEMQRRAWLEGYQMSTETQIDKGGKTGHMIGSVIIGDNIVFFEPLSTTSWVGGIRDDVGIAYRPICFYPETGEEIYREE